MKGGIQEPFAAIGADLCVCPAQPEDRLNPRLNRQPDPSPPQSRPQNVGAGFKPAPALSSMAPCRRWSFLARRRGRPVCLPCPAGKPSQPKGQPPTRPITAAKPFPTRRGGFQTRPRSIRIFSPPTEINWLALSPYPGRSSLACHFQESGGPALNRPACASAPPRGSSASCLVSSMAKAKTPVCSCWEILQC